MKNRIDALGTLRRMTTWQLLEVLVDDHVQRMDSDERRALTAFVEQMERQES